MCDQRKKLLAEFNAYAAEVCTPKLPAKDKSLQHIAAARKEFALLGTINNLFGYTIYLINEHMAKGGFGYAALDPTGQKSEEKMRALFNLRAHNGYLGNIKNVLTHMRRSTSGVRENTDEIVLNRSLGYLKETPSNDPSLKTDKASIARSMKVVVNAGYNVDEHTGIFKKAAEDVQTAKSSGLKGKKLSRRANRIYRKAFKDSANAL